MQIEDVDDSAFFTYKPETGLKEIIITKKLSEYISKFDNYYDYADFKSVIYHHHNERKNGCMGRMNHLKIPKLMLKISVLIPTMMIYYSFDELSHEITDLVFESNKFSTLIRKIIRLYNNGNKDLLHEPLFGFGLNVCLDVDGFTLSTKASIFWFRRSFWCCNLFEILCHSLEIDRHNSISFVLIIFLEKGLMILMK